MAQNHRLSSASHDSSVSDHSRDVPCRVLKKHGYTMQKEIGRGISGIVFLVTNADGDPYVVKQLNSRDMKELNSVKMEVDILKTVNFGYIVTYVDSFEEKEAGHFYIVMEYCEGGDLSKMMQTQREEQVLEEKQIIAWLVQICLALQNLHGKNILHRDIKPQNVFLTEDGYISLGDFGCSKVLERADEYAKSLVGAQLYISPEVYKKRYSSKSDIWSFGWLLHDLCMLDVWADDMERQILHAFSMRGNPPDISERYSEELRELIRQMLSHDPKNRPSADDILAKPFLEEAVKRNKRIPEALEQSFMNSVKTFHLAYNNHYKDLESLVSEWGKITNSMESAHYSATAGSLSGSVIGAAGGITALVGVILASFTLGASLIVTGVGIGVGVAGGVTGAASSITNAVQQNSFRESLKNIQEKYKNISEPILNSLNALRWVMRKIAKFSAFFSNSNFDNVQMACSVDNRRIVCAKELMNLCLLANVGRFAAQTARAGRIAAEAVSGVLSGLLLVVDTAFIVVDSVDIHQMRRGNVDDPESVRSNMLKSIAQMRKTYNELCKVLFEIERTREELKDYI